MPTQTYLLAPDDSRRLNVTWKPPWKDTTIWLDGEIVGTVPGRKELLAGQAFRLPDGSVLKVQLVSRLTGSELYILRDGQPLPGSASHPETRLRTAAMVLFLVGGFDMVFGLMAAAQRIFLFPGMGVGIFSIFFGVAMLVAGWCVRRGSMATLMIAVGILAADGIVGIVLTLRSGGMPEIWGLLFRGMALVPLFQAIDAIRDAGRRSDGPTRPV